MPETVSLSYVKEGSGRALLMLHGNGEDKSIFYSALPILAKSFTVYLIDSRSHGDSPKGKLSYSIMAEDIKSFIDEHKLIDPIIYGFSDGAIITLLLLSKYPEISSEAIISGANTKPHGLKEKVLKEIRKEFKKTNNPLLRLMLREPDIKRKDLAKIKADVTIFMGEHDMIRISDARKIRNNIKSSHLVILEKEDHGSYIVGSSKIAYLIEEYTKMKC